jgi:hypothetical protein
MIMISSEVGSAAMSSAFHCHPLRFVGRKNSRKFSSRQPRICFEKFVGEDAFPLRFAYETKRHNQPADREVVDEP